MKGQGTAVTLNRSVASLGLTLPPSYISRPNGQVAQLVEQRTENPRVGGSIPSLAIELSSPRNSPLYLTVPYRLWRGPRRHGWRAPGGGLKVVGLGGVVARCGQGNRIPNDGCNTGINDLDCDRRSLIPVRRTAARHL
jgi:hypothetical protein